MRKSSFAVSVCLIAGVMLWAQDVTPRGRLEQVAAANSLVRDGGKPWHLRVGFELNELTGKLKEKGTIEEWWVSPKVHRVVVTSPSYQMTEPTEGAGAPVWNREAYLVHALLAQYIDPVADFGAFEKLEVNEKQMKLGKVQVSCLVVSKVDAAGYMGPQYCTEPGSTSLRVAFQSSNYSAVRNRMARFRDVSLGLDEALAYDGRVAIAGHVDVLESLTPSSASAVPMTTASTELWSIPDIVTQGRNINRTQPVYPLAARQEHLSGTVVLCALITKKGMISSLDVVSSPSPILSAAAMDAVKRWTYMPYLVDGVAQEVDTTVVVNFNLRG